MEFRDDLPNGCPPPEATEIVNPTIVFRLVEGDEPSETDFLTHRQLWPNKNFQVSECQVRGLSVQLNAQDSRRFRALPTQKHKKIAKVHLDKGAGYIQRTGRHGHFTWWPFKGFDFLGNCEVVER